MTRSKHSEDFKKEAVRLVIRNNRQTKQVAEELGVNNWTLKGWFRRYGKEIHSELVAGGLRISPEEEMRLLKKELADVTEERDILKKAIAVFSITAATAYHFIMPTQQRHCACEIYFS